MDEYIDRENYCKNICLCDEKKCDKKGCSIYTPPAADVVAVVRCKNCSYWDAVKNPQHAGKGICCPPNRSLGGYCTRRGATTEDDYCSQGKRKDVDGR